MAGNKLNDERVHRLEPSLKQFQENVEQSFQQINTTLQTHTTHVNDQNVES